MALDDAGRNANGSDTVWYIADHHRAGPDDGVSAHRNFVDEGRPGADVGAVANGHIAANGRPWIEVDVVPQNAIMGNGSLHIQNAVPADAGASRDDCSRSDARAIAD